MKPFIPGDATHLSEAIEAAAREWFAKEMVETSLTPHENKSLIAFIDAKANLNVSEDERARLLRQDNIKYVESLRRRLSRKEALYKDAWDRLSDLLYSGRLTVLVMKDSGHTISVPQQFWASREGQSYFAIYKPTGAPSKARYHLSFNDGWDHRHKAVPFVLSAELDAVLRGSKAAKMEAPEQPEGANMPPTSPGETKNRGGSPPKYDPVEFLIEAARLIHEGVINPTQPSELRAAALDAYQERTGLTPSDDWAKPIIRKFWNRLELGKRE